jgi:hypothetical protein
VFIPHHQIATNKEHRAMNTFNQTKTDNSLSAVINRVLNAAFSVAVIGAVGVMTTIQFLATTNI